MQILMDVSLLSGLRTFLGSLRWQRSCHGQSRGIWGGRGAGCPAIKRSVQRRRREMVRAVLRSRSLVVRCHRGEEAAMHAPSTRHRIRNIAYWTCTAIVVFELVAGS